MRTLTLTILFLFCFFCISASTTAAQTSTPAPPYVITPIPDAPPPQRDPPTDPNVGIPYTQDNTDFFRMIEDMYRDPFTPSFIKYELARDFFNV